MIHAFAEKTVVLVKPQSVTAAATVTGSADCSYFDYATIDVVLDSQAATGSMPTVLKLSESDDTVVTNMVDITGAIGGTAGNTSSLYVIPNADTANPQVIRFFLDRRGSRKRYVKVTISPAVATQLLSATLILRRAREGNIPTGHGQAAQVVVIP